MCLPLSLVVHLQEESTSAFSFSRSKKVVLHLNEPLPGNLGHYENISRRFIIVIQ